MANTSRIDGQGAAIELLRHLQEMNWSGGEKPRKSARLVEQWMVASIAWPNRERLAFARVLSDWLVTSLLGCGWELEDYEESCNYAHARRDQQFQKLIAVMASAAPASALQAEVDELYRADGGAE
jgi:hypothetical protein